jgi:hypothetical protein
MKLVITLFSALALSQAQAAPKAALEPAMSVANLSAKLSLRLIWQEGEAEPVAFQLEGPVAALLEPGDGWPGAQGLLQGEIRHSRGMAARRLRLRLRAAHAGTYALKVLLTLKDGSHVQASAEAPGRLDLKVEDRKLSERDRLVYEAAQKQADDPDLDPREKERLSRLPWTEKPPYDPSKHP